MSSRIDNYWYGHRRPLVWLWPLAWLWQWVSSARRRRYGSRKQGYRPALPVLVVGNITVGGTGKSPFVAWLVARLQARSYRPVILSRGYGGQSEHYPMLVTADSDPVECGDEPVMLAQQCGCYVVVDPRRARAAAYAERQLLGDILVCDDGLQHYPLQRDMEFALFDGARGAGNQAPVPVGPLREPLSRLRQVSFCLSTGTPSHSSWSAIRRPTETVHEVRQGPWRLRHLHTGEIRALDWLHGLTINAVAGIANPNRFFDTLTELDAKVIPHPFPDHYAFRVSDFQLDHGPVVMTAKDAVKCRHVAPEETWVLDVMSEPVEDLEDALFQRLNEIERQRRPMPTTEESTRG